MDRADLERRIDEALVRDRRILRERLRRLRGGDRPARRRLEASIARSCAARAARAARLPAPELPPDLPITAQRLAIAAAVERHPVVVVRGETGSGKTTQLPKICLAAGRGGGGLDRPHPAAADRGAKCGRPHRARAGRAGGGGGRIQGPLPRRGRPRHVRQGDDGRDPRGRDRKDRLLEAYDTLILDEAHERSLNIDLLLGHVKEVLAHRPDLRVIVSSATLDTQRISGFFGDAPVIDVSEERTRSRSATWRRGALPRTRSRPCRRRSGRSRGKGRATSSSSCPASATSGRRPGPFARTVRSRCCPSTRASTTPSRSGSSAPASGGGWCWRRTSRRPPSPCPASGSWSTPGSPASAGTAIAPRSSAFPSSRSRAPPPSSAAGGAGGSGRARACGSIRGRTSRAGRDSPRPRSGGRTSRP